MALNGNELVLVTGVTSTGAPSGEQFQTTTQQIANLGGGGSGTVTTTGSPASGNMTKFSGATTITNAVSGTDYQAPLTLTTTGSSGAATLISNTLNIPQYSGGGIARSISSISTNITAGNTASTDYVYFCTGTITLTLPTAVGNTNSYKIINFGTGVITIAGTIDGATNLTLSAQYEAVEILSNNTAWGSF